MPVLIMTPDISAETWDGAAGCALGSQTCSGMMPALTPKPISAEIKIAFLTSGEAAAMPLADRFEIKRAGLPGT